MNLAETLTSQFAGHSKQFGFTPSLYELICRDGEPFTMQRLCFNEARHIVNVARLRDGVDSLRPKECFMNAQRIALDDHSDQIDYCEGYFAFENCPFPILHGWNVINGKVVDLTARASRKDEAHSYLGIRISHALLREHILETELYCSVIEGPCAAELFGIPKKEARSHENRDYR